MQQQSLDPGALPFLRPHLVPEKHCFNCFTGQLPDERAFLIIQRHWIIDVFLLIRLLFWIAVPLFLFGALTTYIPNVFGDEHTDVTRVVLIFVLLFVWLQYYVHWIDERLDFVVLTDRRIVDIDQNRLFNREVTEASLAQIQDVKTEVKGVIATLLRYGNIEVQTASEEANIKLRVIGHPNSVSNQILKIRDEYLAKRRQEGAHEVEMSGDI